MTLEHETYVVDINVTTESPLDFDQRRGLFEARQRTMSQTIALCIALMSIVPTIVATIYAVLGATAKDKPLAVDAALGATAKDTLLAIWTNIKCIAGISWLSFGISVLLAMLFLGLGPKWVRGLRAEHPVTTMMDYTYWFALGALATGLGLMGVAMYKVLY